MINKKPKMKSLFLLLTILYLADGQCVNLLKNYYNCLEGRLTIENRNDSNVTLLSDSYYGSVLKGINTFQAAMNLFKSIYQKLKPCVSDKCKCAKGEYYYKYDFEYFFTDSTYFTQIVTILNSVKTQYRLLPHQQILNYDLLFDANYPTLNSFCINFEYGAPLPYFYNQTFSCYYRLLSNIKYYHDCRSSYLTLNIYTKNQSLDWYTVSQLENYCGCVASLFQTCEVNIRRAILLEFMAEAPRIIKGSNLVAYVDYLTSLNVRPIITRNETTVSGKSVASLSKDQLCDFASDQNYTFLDSPFLKIFGLTSPLPLSSSNQTYYIMFITFTFKFILSEGTTYTYTWPSDLDPKPTSISKPNNEIWLEISYESNNVIIVDYNTKSTIKVYDCKRQDGCKFDLSAPADCYVNSTGILVIGCPQRPPNKNITTLMTSTWETTEIDATLTDFTTETTISTTEIFTSTKEISITSSFTISSKLPFTSSTTSIKPSPSISSTPTPFVSFNSTTSCCTCTCS